MFVAPTYNNGALAAPQGIADASEVVKTLHIVAETASGLRNTQLVGAKYRRPNDPYVLASLVSSRPASKVSLLGLRTARSGEAKAGGTEPGVCVCVCCAAHDGSRLYARK